MHLSPLVHPPGDAYAHCFGIFPGLPTVAFGCGVAGVVEKDAGVEPVGGFDFGTDSLALPCVIAGLFLEFPFLDSLPYHSMVVEGF